MSGEQYQLLNKWSKIDQTTTQRDGHYRQTGYTLSQSLDYEGTLTQAKETKKNNVIAWANYNLRTLFANYPILEQIFWAKYNFAADHFPEEDVGLIQMAAVKQRETGREDVEISEIIAENATLIQAFERAQGFYMQMRQELFVKIDSINDANQTEVLLFSGVSSGGNITILDVTITASNGDTSTTVAQAMATALNDDPKYQSNYIGDDKIELIYNDFDAHDIVVDSTQASITITNESQVIGTNGIAEVDAIEIPLNKSITEQLIEMEELQNSYTPPLGFENSFYLYLPEGAFIDFGNPSGTTSENIGQEGEEFSIAFILPEGWARNSHDNVILKRDNFWFAMTFFSSSQYLKLGDDVYSGTYSFSASFAAGDAIQFNLKANRTFEIIKNGTVVGTNVISNSYLPNSVSGNLILGQSLMTDDYGLEQAINHIYIKGGGTLPNNFSSRLKDNLGDMTQDIYYQQVTEHIQVNKLGTGLDQLKGVLSPQISGTGAEFRAV